MARVQRQTRPVNTNYDDVREALLKAGIPDPSDTGELLPDPATHAARNGRPYQDLLKARDMQIWALRIRGFSAEAIAKHYSIGETQVNNAIARASASISSEVPQTVVKLELARLDYLLIKALDVLETTHVAFSHGQVMYNPNTDEPYVDTAPVLNAITVALKIQERRAKLMALDKNPDAPTTSDDLVTPDLQAMIDQVNTAAEAFLKSATTTQASASDNGEV